MRGGPLPRLLTPEPLNVAPGLIGRVLATPRRRALAMAVDLLVVALLSGASSVWLAAGLVLVVLQLRDPQGGTKRLRAAVGWALVLAFVVLAAQEAWQAWRGPRPPAATVSHQADDGDAAAAPAAASAPADLAAAQQRIADLEDELAQARQPRPWTLRHELRRVADGLGASFGWGIVYFSLLPAFWNGQTLGKRLLRLQVVELTGQPMTVMRCLRRYGGYAAGMATGGLGFAQALWDVNLQGIQDRTAHTVVIDLRPREPAGPD